MATFEEKRKGQIVIALFIFLYCKFVWTKIGTTYVKKDKRVITLELILKLI